VQQTPGVKLLVFAALGVKTPSSLFKILHAHAARAGASVKLKTLLESLQTRSLESLPQLSTLNSLYSYTHGEIVQVAHQGFGQFNYEAVIHGMKVMMFALMTSSLRPGVING
jgi:hypothetical protein